MATLIQSKQIQGVVTASVIEGEFLVSGSLVTSGSIFVDGDITASGIIRATQFIGDGSGLTGIVATGTGISFQSGSTSATITKLEISGSGAIVSVNSNTASIRIDYTDISSLNSYTSSQNTKNSALATYTASVDTKFSTIGTQSGSWDNTSLNLFTQSIDSRVDNLESWSSSLTDTFATDLEVSIVSSSVAATIGIISQNTGLLSTASFNSFSQSVDILNTLQTTRIDQLAASTASVNSFTESALIRLSRIEESTSSLNSFTSSINTTIKTKLDTDGVVSGSSQIILSSTDGFTTYSGSVATSISASAAYVLAGATWDVLSGKPAGIVSGSTQITSLLPTGVISGSAQLTTDFDSRYLNTLGEGIVSSSAQITSLLPSGVVSGSSQILGGSGIVSSSDQITSSLDNKYVLSGSITQTTWDNIASKPGGIVSGSSQITDLGFISSSQTLDTGSLATTGSNTFIGTQIISGSLNVSGTINPDNVTVGIPTSNAWQSSLNGSYFNNFTSETNVSEILRFVAGLLSASAPDATPNTKTLASITANEVNTTTGTALVGRIPQSSTNTTIIYLNSKGFATAGSTIFSGITPIYTSNYGRTYTSVAGGTTIASSSADAQLFGLGTLSSGVATSFKVSGSFTHRFKDNSSKTDTATSSSVITLEKTGAGTTSGVTLALINTVNPAVIPPGYQDGKFSAVFSPYLYSGSATAVSASGYYHISSSIQIASGSSGYSTAITANGTEVFWAPLSTISTNVPTQTPTLVVSSYVPLTATSRSLSGAPYLTGATYEISASVSGAFNPLFYNGTIASITEVDSLVTSTGISTVATSGGTISTANAVYGIDNTLRSTSTIPYETDTIRLNSKFTFTPSTNENINQTGLGTTSFVATISGYNFTGTQTSTTATIPYHSGSTFGQPLSSGSMAYYGASQASDASATTLYEPFLGENYRIQLADNVLAFNGTAWPTSFGLYNLGTTDLQVKPGHLIKPGGTYAYWLGNPSTASDYKYYIRKFTTSGVKTSITLNLGQTLVAWDSSTTGVSAVILFESSKNTIYTPARVYDPTKTLSNFVSTISANTDGQNPFGSSIDLYGNTGGSVSSTTYTIPLRNGDGMFLNATYTNIYVIVRYKGDPTPVASITIA